MTIHPSNTAVASASIAWEIEPLHRSGFNIVIRHVCVDGVEIAGAELSSGVIAELRDVVRASPEYDADHIGQLVRDLRYESAMDERADNARRDRAIERDMNAA